MTGPLVQLPDPTYVPWNLERVLRLAIDWHDGQTDQGGAPYIWHPIRVALQMPTLDGQVVALLHDVLEDCPQVTPRTLLKAGIPVRLVNALQLLQHREGEPYRVYITGIKPHRLARSVKIADLTDNMNGTRLGALPEETAQRLLAKYEWALWFLRQP